MNSQILVMDTKYQKTNMDSNVNEKVPEKYRGKSKT